jgi:hypothetical protein
MYVIIPCITGASKPNERLYQNDRLQAKLKNAKMNLNRHNGIKKRKKEDYVKDGEVSLKRISV